MRVNIYNLKLLGDFRWRDYFFSLEGDASSSNDGVGISKYMCKKVSTAPTVFSYMLDICDLLLGERFK